MRAVPRHPSLRRCAWVTVPRLPTTACDAACVECEAQCELWNVSERCIPYAHCILPGEGEGEEEEEEVFASATRMCSSVKSAFREEGCCTPGATTTSKLYLVAERLTEN